MDSIQSFIFISFLVIIILIITIVKGYFNIKFWDYFFNNEDDTSSDLNLEPKQIETLIKGINLFSGKKLPTSEISITLPIQYSEDIIIMMKYVTNFRNVFRCKPDGSVIWQAELPTKTDDVYTNIQWRNGRLTAYSRSNIFVTLDPETGKILSR